jgi:hypothetical protein
MKLPAAMVAALSLATPAEAEQKPAPERVAAPIVREIAPTLGGIPPAMEQGSPAASIHQHIDEPAT